MKKRELENWLKRLNGQWANLQDCSRIYRSRYNINDNPGEVLPYSQSYSIEDLLDTASKGKPLLDMICQPIVKKHGGIYSSQVKNRKRIEERLSQSTPLGDIEDPLRATLCVSNLNQLTAVLQELIQELRGETTERIKVTDYFAAPLDYGYIGIQVETLLPIDRNGEMKLIRTEIQIHTFESIAAREKAHKYYEEMRSLMDETNLEGEKEVKYYENRIASIKTFVAAFNAILNRQKRNSDGESF